MRSTAHRRGFSLIEMSLVLLIMALLAAAFLTAGVAAISEKKKDLTAQRMQAVQDALLAFRRSNHRLPCPAHAGYNIGSANYGVEAANHNSGCTGGTPAADFTATNLAAGGVPTKTLGLSDDFMYDGWGRKFTYAVDTRTTVNTGSACSTSTYPITDTTTFLTVTDGNGNTRTAGAWYVLISHGPNGHGAFLSSGMRMSSGSTNTNELTNCHCNSTAADTGWSSTFVEQLTTENSSNPLNRFDDIVRYGERMNLLSTQDETGAAEGCS